MGFIKHYCSPQRKPMVHDTKHIYNKTPLTLEHLNIDKNIIKKIHKKYIFF